FAAGRLAGLAAAVARRLPAGSAVVLVSSGALAAGLGRGVAPAGPPPRCPCRGRRAPLAGRWPCAAFPRAGPAPPCLPPARGLPALGVPRA
ncbi:hypothetical protein C3R44_23280, partial [Mycobacterium tuberculosis]